MTAGNKIDPPQDLGEGRVNEEIGEEQLKTTNGVF